MIIFNIYFYVNILKYILYFYFNNRSFYCIKYIFIRYFNERNIKIEYIKLFFIVNVWVMYNNKDFDDYY